MGMSKKQYLRHAPSPTGWVLRHFVLSIIGNFPSERTVASCGTYARMSGIFVVGAILELVRLYFEGTDTAKAVPPRKYSRVLRYIRKRLDIFAKPEGFPVV